MTDGQLSWEDRLASSSGHGGHLWCLARGGRDLTRGGWDLACGGRRLASRWCGCRLGAIKFAPPEARLSNVRTRDVGGGIDALRGKLGPTELTHLSEGVANGAYRPEGGWLIDLIRFTNEVISGPKKFFADFIWSDGLFQWLGELLFFQHGHDKIPNEKAGANVHIPWRL